MKYTCLTLFFLLFSLASVGQNFEGSWRGTLEISSQTKLDLVIHISKDSKGNWNTKLDSPNQMAYGILLKETVIKEDTLSIKDSNLNLKIEGVRYKEQIKSTFEQNGLKKELLFYRNILVESNHATLNRPQTPKPTKEYREKEVSFSNKSNGILLKGTLSIPASIELKKAPAMVLIVGSGSIDRDETICAHKPFAVIADFFAKRGFVVLRYDKRGVGKSEGDLKRATTKDLAEDAEYAIDYLKQLYYIDKNSIGVIGHSEGALIAADLASKKRDISYIVMMAGPTTPFTEILTYQLTRDYNTPQFENTIKKALHYIVTFDEEKVNLTNLKDSIHSILQNTELPPRSINQLVNFLISPWMVYLLKNNPTDIVQRVNTPTLAIYGEKDRQIQATPNLAAIKKCMRNKGVLTTKIYPNLNHLFQNCKTGNPTEYCQIEETIAPIVLNDIYNWISKIREN